jgi:predicted enzyme related to lactoylglutathione lyase
LSPTRARYPTGTPCWFDLVADEPARAAEYYAALLGWEITTGHVTEAPYLVARIDGRTVAGISMRTADGPPPGWVVYFACPDVVDLSDRIGAAGGQVVTAAADEGADGTSVVFRDPAGAIAGGWQPGRVAGAGLTGEPSSVVAAELHTSDPAGSKRFYRVVVGVDFNRPTATCALSDDGRSRWAPNFASPRPASRAESRPRPGRQRDPWGAEYVISPIPD